MVKILPTGCTKQINILIIIKHKVMKKIPIASFHLEGEALIWFQDVEGNGKVHTCESFYKSCITRFGLTVCDDPMESMTRLRQIGTVAIYKV
jgi:hypothetical protein